VVSGYRKSADDPAAGIEEAAVVATETILQTKLHHPTSPVDLVLRTQLIARLLTLVSASAGHGGRQGQEPLRVAAAVR